MLNPKMKLLKPFGKTVMNSLQEANLASIAIGKISDIFDGEGVTKAIRTVSNMDGMDKFINILDEDFLYCLLILF